MLNNSEITTLINLLNDGDIEWTRFDCKNAYFSDLLVDNYRLFRSYNTIVGLIDISDGVFYEINKYSTTTSKQVTQFYNRYYRNFERVLVHINNALFNEAKMC